MNEDWLDTELRRALHPSDFRPELKARLSDIPRIHPRGRAEQARPAFDVRWLLGLGFASALGALALGLWLGGSMDAGELDALALFTGSDLETMEDLL